MTNLEIKNLSFQYNDLNLFSDFSFVPSDRFNLLKGHSGCGKTTLLKIIFGQIEISDGQASFTKPDNCYLILQDDALLPWLSGEENIKFISEINVVPSFLSEYKTYLSPFIKKKAYQMSFGQRRLVELYRALLYCPELLLLDEPFNYLDERSREVVSKAISGYLDTNTGSTIVMSSHLLEQSEYLSPKTYLFKGAQPYNSLIADEE
jgi:NitT/TauT family transport system ATP-binding protein